MPIVCNLLEVPPAAAEELAAAPSRLAATIQSVERYNGAYRYWHAIDYLLEKHVPEPPGLRLLQLGQPVPSELVEVPAPRLLFPAEVQRLDEVLRTVEPEALIPHYDAAALDEAGIYPNRWVAWEEEFEPLGQVLEYFSYLKYFVGQCAEAKTALLFRFEFKRDETDD
jgi:hypothetical protein